MDRRADLAAGSHNPVGGRDHVRVGGEGLCGVRIGIVALCRVVSCIETREVELVGAFARSSA